MEIDVSNAIAGIDYLLEQIENNVTAATEAEAMKNWQRARKATSYAFQTVPSYLLEHRFKSNGKVTPKQYPDDTIATFSRERGVTQLRRELIGNLTAKDDDDIIIQQYGSPGPLHKFLQTSEVVVERRGGGVQIRKDVGYPKGVGDDEGTEHIKWVYFGTDRMIGRPFLEEIVYGHEKEYRQAVEKGVRDAIASSTTPGPRGSGSRAKSPIFRAAQGKSDRFHGDKALRISRARKLGAAPLANTGRPSNTSFPGYVVTSTAQKADVQMAFQFQNLFGAVNPPAGKTAYRKWQTQVNAIVREYYNQ